MSDSQKTLSLQERVELHIEWCNAKTKEYQARCEMDDARHQQTVDAIEKLTATTQGVVDAWVFANTFHRFIKWLSGFAILVAVAAWLSNKIGT